MSIGSVTQAASSAMSASDAPLSAVTSGLITPTSVTRVGVTSPGAAYVQNARVFFALGDSRLTATYAPLSDTYTDIDDTGNFTRIAVANGAAAPALTANSIRLEKVVTSGTAITSVVRLAADRVPLIGVRNPTNNTITKILDPSGVNPYGFAVFPLDINGYAVGNIIPRTDTLANFLLIAGGVNEIGVATDKNALVRFNGVVGGATIIASTKFRDAAKAVGSANTLVTATPLVFALDGAIGGYADQSARVGNGWAVPTWANRMSIEISCTFPANATGTRTVAVLQNGVISANFNVQNTFNAVAVGETTVNLTALASLVAPGDLITVQGTQNSGGNLVIASNKLFVYVAFWAE